MANYLDMDKLANLVRNKRLTRGLRETAKEIGNVSPSTISRVENGKTPDMETFLALC
jgi:transcriptional regulator with XRE-family HTH domain